MKNWLKRIGLSKGLCGKCEIPMMTNKSRQLGMNRARVVLAAFPLHLIAARAFMPIVAGSGVCPDGQ
jgi:hypothetical protein